MNFATWKVRGLCERTTQKEVIHLVDSHKLDFIVILETRVQDNNRNKVARKLMPGWKLIHNDVVGLTNHIWVCYNPLVFHMCKLMGTDQLVHMKVTHKLTNFVFHVSVVMLTMTMWTEWDYGTL